MIVSSTWKVQQKSKAESYPNSQPLPQRLQPPLTILTNILSFIEQSMGYDGPCGVNKQWLTASQNVPNATVQWKKNRIVTKVPSFVLALRKHPSATSFIDFPMKDIDHLMKHKSFDMSTLRSLSLINNSGQDTYFPDMRLPSIQSLSIHHGPDADREFVDDCYHGSTSFLDSFNEEYLKGNKTDNDVPKIRFNGRLPVKCMKKFKKREDYPEADSKHGYTYQRECNWCHRLKNICCNRNFSDCDSTFGCGNVKGVSNSQQSIISVNKDSHMFMLMGSHCWLSMMLLT
jgi:hypothetical protein